MFSHSEFLLSLNKVGNFAKLEIARKIVEDLLNILFISFLLTLRPKQTLVYPYGASFGNGAVESLRIFYTSKFLVIVY